MPNIVRVQVDNASDLLSTSLYGAGALVRLQSSSTETGTYANVTTAPIVAGTDFYQLNDAAGTSATWYRTRYESSGGTITSDWTPAFQATVTEMYASLDELVQRLDLPDTTEYALLEDILVAVSAQMDAEANRRFYRIPSVSGTTIRTYDGDGDDIMFVPEGVVSLTTVEVADSTGGAYRTLGSSSWFLRPRYPTPAWPYTEIHLDGEVFPDGWDTVRLTGVFGFSEVPALVKEAVLELSARTYHESKTRHSGLAGIGDFGAVSVPQYRPDAWHRALRAFGRILQ